jgi:hypothetical protein
LNGMQRTREKVRVPLTTNTVVVNFEQLAVNAVNMAVDVILLDTTFWGVAGNASNPLAFAKHFSWVSPCIPPVNLASNWPRCFTWARSFRTSHSPPTRIIII